MEHDIRRNPGRRGNHTLRRACYHKKTSTNCSPPPPPPCCGSFVALLCCPSFVSPCRMSQSHKPQPRTRPSVPPARFFAPQQP
jgi:hypothetical protein